MILHRPSRSGSNFSTRNPVVTRRRSLRPRVIESLEERVLLSPTSYVVTVPGDNGSPPVAGSLRFEVNAANTDPNPDGSIITFDAADFPAGSTMTLENGPLTLSESPGPEVIDGPGASKLTISGANASQVFHNTTTATVSGLTVSGGSTTANGGGISNIGTLAVTDCTISGNSANGTNAGGIYGGGGIYSSGSLTLTGCTISGNSVNPGTGGGRCVGGGIDSVGPLKVTDCTVTGNSVTGNGSDDGGGIYGKGTSTVAGCTVTGNSLTNGDGGGIFNQATMTVEDSTIARNNLVDGVGGGFANSSSATLVECAITDNSVSSGLGGGVFNTNSLTVADCAITGNSVVGAAGGLCNPVGTTTISNSTIANNAASAIGGVGVFAGSMTAINVTISGNSSGLSGYEGYSVVGGLEIVLGQVTLDNTIVAQNFAGSSPSDIAVYGAGQVTSSSANNLIGTGGSGGLTSGVNSNQVGVADPGLGPLASNGGPTQTMALLPGSPAIDAGNNALAINPSTDQPLVNDQRAAGFPRVFNKIVDIGAYELEADATIAAVAVGWGTQTAALQTASDGVRLLPAGRSTDLPWLGIDELQITFNEPVALTASDITIQDVKGINYAPVTVTGSGMTYTIAFAQKVEKADEITFTVAGPGFTAFTRRLAILPGDFDDNGVVNNKDVKGVRAEVRGTGGAVPTIFGDVLGDGNVTRSDIQAVRRFLGKKLPAPAGPMEVVALARPLVRQYHDVRRHHHV